MGSPASTASPPLSVGQTFPSLSAFKKTCTDRVPSTMPEQNQSWTKSNNRVINGAETQIWNYIMRCNLGNAALGDKANHCTFYVKAEGAGPDRKAATYTVTSHCADHTEHAPERSTLLKARLANRIASRTKSKERRSSAVVKQTSAQPEADEVDELEDSQVSHGPAPAEGMLVPIAKNTAQSVIAKHEAQSVLEPSVGIAAAKTIAFPNALYELIDKKSTNIPVAAPSSSIVNMDLGSYKMELQRMINETLDKRLLEFTSDRPTKRIKLEDASVQTESNTDSRLPALNAVFPAKDDFLKACQDAMDHAADWMLDITTEDDKPWIEVRCVSKISTGKQARPCRFLIAADNYGSLWKVSAAVHQHNHGRDQLALPSMPCARSLSHTSSASSDANDLEMTDKTSRSQASSLNRSTPLLVVSRVP